MDNYLEVVKTAAVFFPFIALLLSLPFLLSQYHKYGAVSFWKACLIYTFVFYLLCAYFLVILPLPDVQEVAKMTTPRMQLMPFQFLIDFFTHLPSNFLNPHDIFKIFTTSYFFVPVYNILLTLPFGIFLHYYYRFDLKKTIISSFLLSLFFELTQLSGLYFIYPRGYRLFDVDDLILNTLGGALGYLIANPLIKILPSVDSINASARQKAKVVSGLRRTLALVLDFVLYLIVSVVLYLILPETMGGQLIMVLAAAFYYFLIPLLLHGSTPVQKFLNLTVVDSNNQYSFWRVWLRRGCFLLIYLVAPDLGLTLLQSLAEHGTPWGLILLSYVGLYLFLIIVTGFKCLFTTDPLLYEKISRTRLVSALES